MNHNDRFDLYFENILHVSVNQVCKYMDESYSICTIGEKKIRKMEVFT